MPADASSARSEREHADDCATHWDLAAECTCTQSGRETSGMHPDTIATMRERRPDLSDLPDDALRRLSLAHWTSLHLHVRDLGRAIRKALRR